MVESSKSKLKEEDRLRNEVQKFPCLYDNGNHSHKKRKSLFPFLMTLR